MVSLPVFVEDPFLKYRPFPALESNSQFINHWHEIAASFIFYNVIQLSTKPIASYFLGKSYTSLSTKTKINFDIHVASMFQCVISVAILIPMWNHPAWSNRVSDPISSVLGNTPYGNFVSAVTIGYFLWDVYVCARYYTLFGFGFLFHGVAALYVFGECLGSFCQPWIPAFLIFELSTPFVNINWFATRLPAGTFNDKFVLANGIMLLITFFSVRLVWGIYSVILVAQDMWAVKDLLAPHRPISILAINVLMDALNVFWFYKMVLIAKKKATGASSKTKKVE